MAAPLSVIEGAAGRGIVLRGDDLDTDRIIPARYLKAITFDGLQQHVFADERLEAIARGGTHPFDAPGYRGASVLVVGANFGCGSSREHAPQALRRWGIQAIVGESFGEIFAGNAVMIGLPCLSVSRDDAERLRTQIESAPATEIVVDVRTCRVTAGDLSCAATMPAPARSALLSGHWDATGLLLAEYDEVKTVAGKIPYLVGF